MKNSYILPVDAIILVGPTGAGKSPLGDSIARQGLAGRTCRHLDFGAELRWIASAGGASPAYTSDELSFITGVLERGLLLENEHFSLAKKIIGLFLARVKFSQRDLLILNGIPRHAGQAKDMETIARVRALIVLHCSAEDALCRIRDNVGRDRTEREDDGKELIEKKLNIFQERTAPLIEYYSKKGCRIYRILASARTTTENHYRALSALAAAHPPVALVAEPPQG